MRFLMMFGPMIYRQYQKYTRNKSKQNTAQNSEGQLDQGDQKSKEGEHLG